MKKYNGTLDKSKWDASTWVLLMLVVACCIWPVFLDDGWLPVIISGVTLALIVVILKSIYYLLPGTAMSSSDSCWQ